MLFFKIVLIFASFWLSAGWIFAQQGKKLNYLSNTKTPEEILSLDNKMDRLFFMFCGEFNNRSQADTASSPLLNVYQDIIAVPIWQERAGERWFYMAWFKHAMPERAITHAIFRLSKESRDTFRLTAYVIPQEEENNFYSYEWRKEKPFAQLRPKDLSSYDNCYNLIVDNDEGGFDILPNPDLCALRPSGNLHFISFAGKINTGFIFHYTRYFDQNKKLVFGYDRPDGFRLERLNKNRPIYETLKKPKAKEFN